MLHLLIALVVALVIVGIAWWAINQFALPPPVRMVAVAIIAIVAILLLLEFAGVGGGGLGLGSGRCL